MSEKALIPEGGSAPQGLIKQTEMDRVVAKLERTRERNLSEEEAAKLANLERNFACNFRYFMQKYFRLKLADLEQLSDDELSLAAAAILPRVRSRAWLQKAFTAIPVAGWLIGGLIYRYGGDFFSWEYIRDYERFKKLKGESFFPTEAFRQHLKDWSSCGYS